MNLSSPLPIQHHSFPVWIFLSHPRTSIEGKKAGFSMVCLDGYVRLPDGIYQYYMCSISCVYIYIIYTCTSMYGTLFQVYTYICFHVFMFYTHLRLEKLKNSAPNPMYHCSFSSMRWKLYHTLAWAM